VPRVLRVRGGRRYAGDRTEREEADGRERGEGADGDAQFARRGRAAPVRQRDRHAREEHREEEDAEEDGARRDHAGGPPVEGSLDVVDGGRADLRHGVFAGGHVDAWRRCCRQRLVAVEHAHGSVLDVIGE